MWLLQNISVTFTFILYLYGCALFFQNSSDLKDLQWSRLSFHRSQDDLDDLDEESQEVIYYPPSEASVDTNSRSVQKGQSSGDWKTDAVIRRVDR